MKLILLKAKCVVNWRIKKAYVHMLNKFSIKIKPRLFLNANKLTKKNYYSE